MIPTSHNSPGCERCRALEELVDVATGIEDDHRVDLYLYPLGSLPFRDEALESLEDDDAWDASLAALFDSAAIDALHDRQSVDALRTSIQRLKAWGRTLQGSELVFEPAARELSIEELAQELGVEPFLDSPISAIVPMLQDRWLKDAVSWYRATVRDAEHATFVPVAARGLVQDAARRFLHHAVSLRSTSESRKARWETPPSDERLALLSRRLREFLNSLGFPQPAAAPKGFDRAQVVFDSTTGVVSSDRTYSLATAEIALGGFDTGPIMARGHGKAAEVAWLAMGVLDAVHDDRSRLHERLLAFVAKPGWERLFEHLAQRAEPTRETREPAAKRISFRVEVTPRGLDVITYVHRQGKRGWTSGARTSPHNLRHHEALDRADRRVLNALSASGAGTREGAVSLSAGAAEIVLDELADHPSVHSVDAPSSVLRIRRVDATAALVEVEREGDEDEPDGAGDLTFAMRVGPLQVPAITAAEFLRRGPLVTLIEGGVLYYARVAPAVAEVISKAAAIPARVPHAAWDRLLDVLPDAATALGIDLPASLDDHAEPADLTLVLRIDPFDGGARVALRVRPAPNTPTLPLGNGPRTVVEVRGRARRLRLRDTQEESRVGEALRVAIGLPTPSLDWTFTLGSDEATLSLVDALLDHPQLEVEWPDRRMSVTGRVGDVNVSVRDVGYWFGATGGAEVDGQQVSLAALLAAVRAGSRFVRVGPDRFAAITKELRAKLERAADVLVPHGKGELGVVAGAGDALEALGTLTGDRRWTELRAKLENPPAPPEDKPADLDATLRSYQLDGYRWLHQLAELEQGVCLADDMGLGKTVQALAMLLARRAQGPALVVAPTSLSDNWRREAERFAPSLRVALYRGADRPALLEDLSRYDVLVASYDVVALDIEALSQVEFATLIVDEAQALKNAASQRAKAVARLKARWRLALTGTPIENRLSELWSIFSIVHPGLLGTWEHFRERFARPIEKDRDGTRLAALAQLVRPFVLRRKKEDVAKDLPERLEITRLIELSDAERELYDGTRRKAIEDFASGTGEKQRFAILAALTRLRQLACDPALVHEGTQIRSSKLAALVELLSDIEERGGRALIFSQFTSLLARVRLEFDRRGLRYLELDGSTPAAQRVNLVDRWQAGEGLAFLISLKAGGTGLNLTGADWVVHLDPWWNPAVEDQATDRAHRIGQDKAVTVVRLVSQGTIEEAVLGLHEEKRALARGVLEGADVAGKLSTDELMDLIRAGASDAMQAATGISPLAEGAPRSKGRRKSGNAPQDARSK